MFEAIYISPSCRQAVNFINDLAIKLKQHGIDGFDIGHKNIQLKSDKFVVSAVDIFGGKLGLSHNMTEYYIDIFREGTKEISEEELIEILTEAST